MVVHIVICDQAPHNSTIEAVFEDESEAKGFVEAYWLECWEQLGLEGDIPEVDEIEKVLGHEFRIRIETMPVMKA